MDFQFDRLRAAKASRWNCRHNRSSSCAALCSRTLGATLRTSPPCRRVCAWARSGRLDSKAALQQQRSCDRSTPHRRIRGLRSRKNPCAGSPARAQLDRSRRRLLCSMALGHDVRGGPALRLARTAGNDSRSVSELLGLPAALEQSQAVFHAWNGCEFYGALRRARNPLGQRLGNISRVFPGPVARVGHGARL